ncbi:MAG: YgfZ/GcvT domain-containing protein [Cyanobium sp.]
MPMDPRSAPDPWAWQPAAPARLEAPVTLLRLDGPDSRRFLHGQTSQDLALAPPGAWRRTACLTPTARLRALAEVLVDGGGAWLVITAGDAAAVREAFDRVLFPADAVQLGSLQPGHWLEDPAAPIPAEGGTWEALGEGAGWRLEGGALVLPAGAPLPAPWTERPPLPPAQAERLRIARGEPAAPAEINGEGNPFELGLAARVSLSKGCYLGQETLARLATYDGVKQQLRRWHLPAGAGPTPEPGEALAAEMELGQGEAVRAGQVTSVLALPEGGWIGLALVRRAAMAVPRLRSAGGAWLVVSVPERVQAPPVGAGGQGSQGSASAPPSPSAG